MGEVAEWPNVTDSKSVVPETVPGVRIPPSPPFDEGAPATGDRAAITTVPPTRQNTQLGGFYSNFKGY